MPKEDEINITGSRECTLTISAIPERIQGRPKNRSNLRSRTGINRPCDLGAIDEWFSAELAFVEPRSHQDVIRTVHKHLDDFLKWPASAILLWNGCVRPTDKIRHNYPLTVKTYAKAVNIESIKASELSDTVSLKSFCNGPAVAAFQLAGGARPNRRGSTNQWNIHHIYSGKFFYLGKEVTLHARQDGKHFTQSAGLVAVHPIADQICDEFPCFSWLLRAMAFLKFGYDPDQVFSVNAHDEYGFVEGTNCYVVPPDKTAG
jgi:hypothetical protein